MSLSDSFNILIKQKEQIKAMFELQCETSTRSSGKHSDNHHDGALNNECEPWKILIYDDFCRDIIVPLFSVQELQSFGITLYLSIDGQRHKIPNVPAIYFMQPSASNLDRVAADMQCALYDAFYLNLSNGLKRPQLEYLANTLIQKQCSQALTKMYDQYINYCSLSPDLFTLNMTDCYQRLHAKGSTEQRIEECLRQIVDALFCVLVTLHTIPVIRAPTKECAATLIARQLHAKICNHLRDRNNNLFASVNLQNRPILILLERSIDFAMPLHHSPIYQSLLHDLLHLKSNHVRFGGPGHKKQASIFLDYEHDEFWQKNALQALPKVHEYHTSILTWYQQKKDEIEGAKSPSHAHAHVAEEEKSSLRSTIQSMPELMQKKEEMDRHNKLMTSLSDILSQRGISEYFHLEETLMHSRVLNATQTKELTELLSAHTKGSIEDKLRLFLIWFLCHHQVSKQERTALLTALRTNNNESDPSAVDLFAQYFDGSPENELCALRYILEHEKLSNLGQSVGDSNVVQEEEKTSNTGFQSWIGLTKESIFAQIKGMLPTSGKCTVTRIARSLMNTDIASITNVANVTNSAERIHKEYITLDPLKASAQHSQSEHQEFYQGIVFLVGGGSFAEYANLNQFADAKQKNIIYGCTDLVSPQNFLSQLTNLGR